MAKMVGNKPNELFNDLTKKTPHFSDQFFYYLTIHYCAVNESLARFHKKDLSAFNAKLMYKMNVNTEVR